MEPLFCHPSLPYGSFPALSLPPGWYCWVGCVWPKGISRLSPGAGSGRHQPGSLCHTDPSGPAQGQQQRAHPCTHGLWVSALRGLGFTSPAAQGVTRCETRPSVSSHPGPAAVLTGLPPQPRLCHAGKEPRRWHGRPSPARGRRGCVGAPGWGCPGETRPWGALLCQHSVPSSPTLIQSLSHSPNQHRESPEPGPGVHPALVPRRDGRAAREGRALGLGSRSPPRGAGVQRGAAPRCALLQLPSQRGADFLRHHVHGVGPGQPGTARLGSASGQPRSASCNQREEQGGQGQRTPWSSQHQRGWTRPSSHSPRGWLLLPPFLPRPNQPPCWPPNADGFNTVSVTTARLSHPTATRPRVPGQRPPSMVLGSTGGAHGGEQPQGLPRAAPCAPVPSTRQAPVPARSTEGLEGRSLALEDLKAEVRTLHILVDLMRVQHLRDLQELRQELCQERAQRQALQAEIERMRKGLPC